MALDAKTIGKPFRKLRKLLKDLPDPPAPEDVHEIRTHTRRIEAIVGAVQLDEKSPAKLLERLKPIRKAAGKVRDMDVFIDLAASIQPRSDSDCRLKLIHHLSRQRTKAATRLVKRVDADDKQIRADLKKCASAVDSDFDPARSRNASNKQRQQTRSKAVRSIASSLEIEEEMRHWPRLTQQNIHPFRLKVKQLRYTLQLAEESESKFIDALGQVKDQIGQWHDWNELAAISAKVLDRGSGCDITARIRARAKQELQKALEIADALRTQYLRIDPSRSSEKKPAVREIHPALVEASSRLAS